jgi:hypothetical protein
MHRGVDKASQSVYKLIISSAISNSSKVLQNTAEALLPEARPPALRPAEDVHAKVIVFKE